MDLTRESFDQLLAWLHSDPEEAGARYVKIRSGLVKKFTSHHCSQPEKLADVTIDRVAKKLPEIVDTFVGERERYFYRVAYYVLLESINKSADEVELTERMPLVAPDDDDDVEAEFECLDKCMGGLPPQTKDLITNYYRGEKGAKIRQRRELAVKLNVELPILRVLVLRIRQDLRACILDCLRTLGR
jgi:hypothetical protein